MFNRTAILFCLMASVCHAETNPEIADFLSNVVQDFNSQDCAAYSSHFVESNRQKKRRESGLYFASNDHTMKLKENHILSESEDSAEVAVAYSIKDSDYVSRVFLSKEDGSWKISKELVVRNESPYSDSDSDYQPVVQTGSRQVYTSNPFSNRPLPPQNNNVQNCPGGKCGGPQAPFSTLKACRDYGFEPIPCRNGNCSIR